MGSQGSTRRSRRVDRVALVLCSEGGRKGSRGHWSAHTELAEADGMAARHFQRQRTEVQARCMSVGSNLFSQTFSRMGKPTCAQALLRLHGIASFTRYGEA